MRKLRCPVCGGKYLLTVSDDIYIDFTPSKYTDKVFCNVCKRKIKYSEHKRIIRGDD